MRRRLKLLLLLVVLCSASLACWSSDTLIIHLTATPPPPTLPPTSDAATRYHVGDKVIITAQGLASVYLTQRPEPQTRRNRVANAACYPGTTVEITAVQVVENISYYQIACNGTPGWVVEDSLTPPS